VAGEVVKAFLPLKLGFNEGITEGCFLANVNPNPPVHHPKDGEEEGLLEGEVVF